MKTLEGSREMKTRDILQEVKIRSVNESTRTWNRKLKQFRIVKTKQEKFNPIFLLFSFFFCNQ